MARQISLQGGGSVKSAVIKAPKKMKSGGPGGTGGVPSPNMQPKHAKFVNQ